MFTKILVANRGEIAVRIIRACKEMGIATVAVYSEADREALHVSLADECYCIGGAHISGSYLNMTAIADVAVNTKCQAVHPGYGLLSENAAFCDLITSCGIKFIGPSAQTLKKTGNKNTARNCMREAGVPVVEGLDKVTDVKCARAFAEKIGYPLIIKASLGGGGKGIRVVQTPDQLENAMRIASAEAYGSFGNGELYIEKYLTEVKHVEVQILADKTGNVVILGERDCSVQRSNQKLIEETPCAILPEEVRQKMFASAEAAARAVGYENAGTVEFLLDKNLNYYFMEMNARLQVEHPVTEEATRIDIVKWQIRIASGSILTFESGDVLRRGCAIECRINSEDAHHNFRPNSGVIKLLHIPGGMGVRFDTAVYQDYLVPPYYDSLLGKLIVYAVNRKEAIRKMKAALCELVIEGVETNADFSRAVLSQEEFGSGDYRTDLIGKMMGKKD